MSIDNQQVIEKLNELLEHEMAGVVRYSHYSLMVFGYNRIPIVKWFRDQANESMTHAYQLGEWVTALEGHPSLKIGKLLETHKHSMRDILVETLEHEQSQLDKCHELLKLVDGKHVALEEFTRGLILEETLHLDEVKKMMKSMDK